MGCILTTPADLAEERRKNNEVDRKMAEEFKKEREKIKLLLLGAGESGKTTIFRQMKLLYGANYTQEEIAHFTTIVYLNVISMMKMLCDNAIKFDFVDYTAFQNSESYQAIQRAEDRIDSELGKHIKSLWLSEPIQRTWEKRSSFQVIESHKVYLDEIDRIIADGYTASTKDILLCRIKTTGVVTTKYNIEGTIFEMYDVGGQRNERRKWIHCFEDTTAVIFVASLSEYDQVLIEDGMTNRMGEAIKLFAEVCNNDHFKHSSMILFLNKFDLFQEKVIRIPINSVPEFSDFTGGTDPVQGWQYFLEKFLSQNQNPKREIFYKITCATDTTNIQTVFDSCRQIIISESVKVSFGV